MTKRYFTSISMLSTEARQLINKELRVLRVAFDAKEVYVPPDGLKKLFKQVLMDLKKRSFDHNKIFVLRKALVSAHRIAFERSLEKKRRAKFPDFKEAKLPTIIPKAPIEGTFITITHQFEQSKLPDRVPYAS